ncbi:ATP-binding cassette domain-containing protein [Thermus thermophilus]|uniref:ATP-binding cassette domain-containing protein n=1 Tax=Thermus thermophilus TaxID=274 RepID=UPI0013FD727A|nr:ABC transporter ATP-binding protein [Thermus thermophilus]
MAQLDVEGVTLTFGGVAALSGVSMRVEAGELVSIIGPNGAGKTSLLNCISGFYHPERGRILFEGQDLTRASPHEVTRRGIARAFQNIELFSGLTVLENLLLARHTHLSYGLLQAGLFYGRALAEEVRNRRVVEEVIDFMELEPYRKALVGNLPYGVRKRVEVARALALSPKLLLLDEPMAGMTLEEKEDMVRFILEIRARGTTVILIEHDLGVVMDISDRVYVLDFGQVIAEGRPEEVAKNPRVQEAYMGVEA